ncbi:hypothetical protein J4E91_008944 [Alternaria rosae]|nr:hypothetical protein J4E91_008944 [Alternaria rosae]
MAPANSKKPAWATAQLTSVLGAHVVFQRHNMVVPPRILPDDVERAIRILDQYDPSTAKAGAKDLKPIDYNHASYRVNEDLRPMAKAADMANLHQPGILKTELARRLIEWDLLNIPLMAALLPRSVDKATKLAIPKRVVSTQKKAETEPAESKKRKAVPTKVTAAKKPRSNFNAASEDHNVEMDDQNELDYDDPLPQTAIEGSTSTRTLAQTRTRLRKPRNGQPPATQAHRNANSGVARLARGQVEEDEGGTSDDASAHNREEDHRMLETEVAEVQVAGSERCSIRGQAGRRAKGKRKTTEQVADEKRLKEEEKERKMHNARRLGGYSDPELAEAFRVLHKTVLVPMHGKTQEGVEPAPTDQLGMREYKERLLDEARKEGRKVEV